MERTFVFFCFCLYREQKATDIQEKKKTDVVISVVSCSVNNWTVLFRLISNTINTEMNSVINTFIMDYLRYHYRESGFDLTKKKLKLVKI